MTALSTLFPNEAGGGVGYPSAIPNLLRIPHNLAQTIAAANQDYLVSFIARADVTVDKVAWVRAAATAANVYVGIYDASGTLLSDCAVDADTTTGLHEVDSTNFDLTAGSLYYWALNQSAQVVGSSQGNEGEADWPNQHLINQMSLNLKVFSSIPSGSSGPINVTGAPQKARTNAALLSSQTMTGWTATSHIIAGGFTPA